MGDIEQGLELAQQSVVLANKSGEFFRVASTKAAQADVLHQLGRLVEAENAFREAEATQQMNSQEGPFLYSVRGFRYCELQSKCF